MARKSVHKIVSANKLLEGAVVYLHGDGRWKRELQGARVASGSEAASSLLRDAELTPHLVVGPYLVDVDVDDEGAPRLLRLREVMRETGPTVARQHV